MDTPTLQTIQDIHAAGRQVVLEFAGAGSDALAALHSVAGSSRTILEATDRYCPASMHELLGVVPEKFVDPTTAAAMADRAYLRACRLGDDSRPKLGLAITATIATDRLKRGDHRVCIAIQSNQSVWTFDLVLIKGRRDRTDEEQIVTALLLKAITQTSGIAPPPPPKLLDDERIIEQTTRDPDPLDLLQSGSATAVFIDQSGRRQTQSPPPAVIYSGSFNPLHFGHEALAATAARLTGKPATFEIPAINADKAAIGRGELERRLSQFWRRYPVVVTHAPLFSDKARLFPGATFLLGYDTAARLIDPRFYGGKPSSRDASLAQIVEAGCHVMVAGRAHAGSFKTVAELPIPDVAKDLFIELPAAQFRADVSASDLRAARGITPGSPNSPGTAE
jgi:hypothetical protein